MPYSHAFPPPEGLYDPRNEHDACGVAFVATMTGEASHDIVAKALTALRNLDHRGAAGAEINSGDGAGILMQVPDAFLREVVREAGFELPERRCYAVGTAFLPGDDEQVAKTRRRIEEIAAEEGLDVVGWRDVPVNPDILGTMAASVMPTFSQVFVQGAGQRLTGMALERRAFCLRKRAEHETDVYFPSLSARTLIYKGMLTTDQLDNFFPDLVDERMASALAVVHSRFSTNTFPSWPLSHPFRFIAHNGEINTVMGNRNWMRAREALLTNDVIPGDLERLYPICTQGASDSASFDEVLELLHMAGRSLPHSVLMMIPEAWENHTEMEEKRRDFYRFHSALMEPWDGPACVVFTDGTQIGAVLDRNGLRPSRFWVTDDGLVVLASEVGVLDIDPATVVRKGRLQPGKMFLVDTDDHRIIEDEEIKAELAEEHPYGEWLHAGLIHLDDIPDREHIVHTARVGHPPPAGLRLHRGGAAHPAHADGQHRWRGARLDGHGHADRGTQRQAAAALRLLQPAVRPGHQPAARRDPRGAGDQPQRHHRSRGQPARADARVVPPGRAAVPRHLQRRPGQDPPHQPRRRHAGLHHPRVARPLPRRRRGSGDGEAARRDLSGGQRGDRRRRPRSSCCPTGTRPPTWRRSRPCC